MRVWVRVAGPAGALDRMLDQRLCRATEHGGSAHLGRLDDAVELLTEAAAWEAENGALPFLANTLAALGDALTRRRYDGDIDAASEHWRRVREIAPQLGMAGLLVSLLPAMVHVRGVERRSAWSTPSACR